MRRVLLAVVIAIGAGLLGWSSAPAQPSRLSTRQVQQIGNWILQQRRVCRAEEAECLRESAGRADAAEASGTCAPMRVACESQVDAQERSALQARRGRGEAELDEAQGDEADTAPAPAADEDAAPPVEDEEPGQ